MKAIDLLKLVENSKGGKTAEGELKRPTYKNDKTPDNHVRGKKNRVVGNKIDKGEKHDGKKAPQITPPQKKERRSMEGPGRKVKTMEAVRDNVVSVDPVDKTITVNDIQRNVQITVPFSDSRKFSMIYDALNGTDQARAARAYAAIIQSPEAQVTGSSLGVDQGKGEQGKAQRPMARNRVKPENDRNVYKGDLAAATEKASKLGLTYDSVGNPVSESGGEHSDSMSKQTVATGGSVSKSASVRTKQNDSKSPTAKVGSPKNKEKRSMDANPVTVKDCKGGENEHKSMKKMHEEVADLEQWLGTSLRLNEGDLETFYMDDDQPMTCPRCGARTDFEGDGTQPTKHKCLNQKDCGFEFMAEPYQEDDMEESNGRGAPPGGQVGQAKPSPMSRRGAAMKHHRDSGSIGGDASNYRKPTRR